MSNLRRKRGARRLSLRAVRVIVRLEPDQAVRLDRWRKGLTGSPARPEAMRRLIEQALPGSLPGDRRKKEVAHKASELAANAIERLTDKSRPYTERARAKRRLIHGPKEFRDIRADQPNRKG
jgi:hypothetical protein